MKANLQRQIDLVQETADKEVEISDPDDEPEKEEPKAKKAKAEKAEPSTKEAMVPHGAMHAERERAKKAEKELKSFRAESDQRNARLEERILKINEAMAPRPVQPRPVLPPDPKRNPAAAHEYLVREQRATREYLAEKHRQETEAAQQSQAEEAVWSKYRADASEFGREEGSFQDAYNYLIQSRANELQAMGFDEKKIEAVIKNDEFGIAYQSGENNTNAAETIYKWAQARGFNPAAVAAAPEKGETGTEKIQRLSKSREASSSLSGGGGESGSDKISLSAIDNMSEKEYNDLLSRLNKYDPNGADKLFEQLEAGQR